MRDILSQYGKTIITVVVVVVITGILGAFTYEGATGLIDVAGQSTNRLSDSDVVDTQSASVLLLTAQAAEAVPELTVNQNPEINKQYVVADLFDVANVSKNSISITPTEITTVLNDSSSDAIAKGLVAISDNNITFNQVGEYFLSVDIRQGHRLLTRTYKITAEEPPIKYGFMWYGGFSKNNVWLDFSFMFAPCYGGDTKQEVLNKYRNSSYYSEYFNGATLTWKDDSNLTITKSNESYNLRFNVAYCCEERGNVRVIKTYPVTEKRNNTFKKWQKNYSYDTYNFSFDYDRFMLKAEIYHSTMTVDKFDSDGTVNEASGHRSLVGTRYYSEDQIDPDTGLPPK